MSHKFQREKVGDEELRRRTAEWIDSGVVDLERACECAEGRACHADVRNLLDAARRLAESVRKSPASFSSPTPKE